MTWTALSNSVKSVSDRLGDVNTNVERTVTCGKKGKVYAPGVTGVDVDGCLGVAPNTTTQNNIDNILLCNASGQVYSQTSRTCINAAATAARCSIHMTGPHMTRGGRNSSAATCSSGYTPILTGATGSSGCNTDNGSCYDPQYYFCYRQMCQ